MNAGPGSCWSQPENKQNTSLCPKRQTLPLNSRLLKPARSRQPTHDSRLLRRDVSDSDRKKNVWNKTRRCFRFCCFHVKSVIRLTVPRDDKSADDSLNRDDWDPFRRQTAEETEAPSDYTDLLPGPAGTSARPCQHPVELGHC